MSYFSRLVWSIVSSFSTLKPTQVEDGVIFSLFFIGYVIVQIPSGIIVDSVGSRKVMVGSLLGLSIASLGSAISPSIFWEYVSSLVMGLSAGWIYPTTIKVISGNYKGRELHNAIGLYSLAWPLSIVTSGFLIPPLAIINWELPYIVLFFMTLALSIVSWKVIGEERKPISRRSISFVKDIRVIAISAGGFMFFFSYWSLTLFLYKFLLIVHYNPIIAGAIYSFTAIAGIPSTIISGKILDIIGTRRSLLTFVGMYGIFILLIDFTYKFLIPLSLLFLAMGFVRFIITPSHSSALAFIGGKNSGGVSGFANFFWQFSGIVSSIVSPLIVENLSYQLLWAFMGTITLLSLFFYYMVRVNDFNVS